MDTETIFLGIHKHESSGLEKSSEIVLTMWLHFLKVSK
jgi:hypothetical protein